MKEGTSMQSSHATLRNVGYWTRMFSRRWESCRDDGEGRYENDIWTKGGEPNHEIQVTLHIP